MIVPNGQFEQTLRAKGLTMIAGVDEAGAGALAGPVVSAAVVLPEGHGLAVRDSKTLSAKQRDRLFDEVQATAQQIGVGIVSVEDINTYGIRPATIQSMRRAINALEGLEHVLIDYRQLPGLSIEQTAIIKGDQKEFCIAAASIIAKVTRDRIMIDLEQAFPMYGFAGHKGYGTKAHREAVMEHGRCPHHRSAFTIRA